MDLLFKREIKTLPLLLKSVMQSKMAKRSAMVKNSFLELIPLSSNHYSHGRVGGKTAHMCLIFTLEKSLRTITF